MPKTGKKSSRKQGEANLRGRTRADIDQEPLRTAKAPRNLRLEKCRFLDWQSSFWQDTIRHEPSRDLAETFSNKVTCAWQNRHWRNWIQEIFLQAIAGNSCLTGQLLPRLLESGSACSSLPFAFNFHPASTNGIILPSILFLPRLEQSISPAQSRNLDH